MIRNRIKKVKERRELRRKTKNGDATSNDVTLDDVQTKPNTSSQNDNENDNNDMEYVNVGIPGTQSNDNNNNNDDNNFNYLTDLCKDKKYNKKELKLIIKVIKTELQPLLVLGIFIKNILLWTNTLFSFIVLCILVYIAYINIVNYLFGIILIIICLLMLSMKLNPIKTVNALGFLIWCVADITTIDNDNDTDIDTNNDKPDKKLRRWNLYKKAKIKIKKIKKKIMTLGQVQWLLYQLSIQIGKLRTIYFYKKGNQDFSEYVCIFYGIAGLLCLILPLRFFYLVAVLFAFFINNPLRKTSKDNKLVKKGKGKFNSITPDIPSVQFDDD